LRFFYNKTILWLNVQTKQGSSPKNSRGISTCPAPPVIPYFRFTALGAFHTLVQVFEPDSPAVQGPTVAIARVRQVSRQQVAL
jgi:hypothetical protein